MTGKEGLLTVTIIYVISRIPGMWLSRSHDQSTTQWQLHLTNTSKLYFHMLKYLVCLKSRHFPYLQLYLVPYGAVWGFL